MFDLKIETPKEDDFALLEKWRKEFVHADLELPHGYVNDGVATAVARSKDGTLLSSLTAQIITAVCLDPVLCNPDAPRKDIFVAAFALARTLEYQAQLNGARAAFIAIPQSMPEWQKVIEKCGFEETAQRCKLYRHSFT